MDWHKYLSRKFLLSVAGFAGGTVALLLGKMTGAEYTALIGLLTGLYGASNVGWHFANKTNAPQERKRVAKR